MDKKKVALFCFLFILLASALVFIGRYKKLSHEKEEQQKLEGLLQKKKESMTKNRKEGVSGSERNPNQKGMVTELKKIALVGRKKAKRFKPIFSLRGVDLEPHLRQAHGVFHFNKGRFGELTEVAAIPKQNFIEEQFSDEETLGELNGFLIVRKDALKEDESALPMVVNTRTKKVGIVTGLISVTFENESHLSNSELYQNKLMIEYPSLKTTPRSRFDAINLVIWNLEGAKGVAELFSVENWLGSQDGIKKAQIEILDGARKPH